MRSLPLAFLLLAGFAQAGSLTTQRARTIQAVGTYFQTHPRAVQRCGVAFRDTESMGGRFAFPVNRADRFYQLSYGQGYAFQMRAGRARLVWCGVYLGQPGAKPSVLRGTVVPALQTPMRTLGGVWPVERGSLDVWDAFNASLTFSRVDAGGRTTCTKTVEMPDHALTLPSPDNLRYGCP